MNTTTTTKTVAFFGASTGVGLSTLKNTLAAGHHCIALCRNPSKLEKHFPASTTPNLKIIEGNAKEISDVTKCLQASPSRLVDFIVSTVGGAFIASKFTIDDPEVCRTSMKTLLQALTSLRKSGLEGHPHIIVCSTTGISKFGRDVPLLCVPLYHVMLKVPHEDKMIMEDDLIKSGETFTIVRASLLTDGESDKVIRVGVEDPKEGRESKAVGYTISREDTGKWIAENVVLSEEGRFRNKIAMVTY